MKYIAFFCLCASLAPAADFNTGQAARYTIGQPTFTAQSTDSTNAYELGGAGGLALVNNTLFVVDSNRISAAPVQNRLLIFDNVPQFILPPASAVPQGGRCAVCTGTLNGKMADVVLGQPDFIHTDIGLTQSTLRTPTAVASDGQVLAVADTDNNRVLIWNNIPQSNSTPPDIVVGQPDFTTAKPGTDSKTLRGPQGVWIQGHQLFVADTSNNRVLIWNAIPTTNYQAADVVLGQADFNGGFLGVATIPASAATNMLAPVSVTSDGRRLFITDLGYSRVLIWNSIPGHNQQAADLVIGQPDLGTSGANNVSKVCASYGTDSSNNPLYPSRCSATLDLPRFALSDGTRLFVADGGNDRVLVFNNIPTANASHADAVLGQPNEFADLTTDSTNFFAVDANIRRSSADAIRTPTSLAFDGMNLFVADPYDRRVLVFTPGDPLIPINGITNSASQAVFAQGAAILGGTINANDTVTLTVNGRNYTYTVVKGDTLGGIVTSIVKLVNAGPDPDVLAIGNPAGAEILLVAQTPGDIGNSVAIAGSTSSGAQISITTSSTFLSGGDTTAEVSPGSLITITGSGLSDNTVSATPDENGFYPKELGGVTLYIDGIQAPLLYVSSTQINSQLPFVLQDGSSSASAYLVIKHNDGSVTYSSPVGIPVVMQNPGLFAVAGGEPRTVIAYHASNNATAVVDIGGTIKAADTATLTVNGTAYTYTVQASDTLATIRDNLIGQVNADAAQVVTASPAGQYTRIILTSKTPGPDGNGITVTGAVSSGALIALTALQAQTCCASTAGLPVDDNNPATPGEIITVYATGLGAVTPDEAKAGAETGRLYNGPAFNTPLIPVDDAQVGGKTANVLFAGLVPGALGVYAVELQLDPGLTTNPLTRVFIAQDIFTSNIVTIPVVAP